MNKVIVVQGAVFNALMAKNINANFGMLLAPMYPYINIASVAREPFDEYKDVVKVVLRIATLEKTITGIQDLMFRIENALLFDHIRPFVLNFDLMSANIESESIYTSEDGFLCGIICCALIL